ARKIHILITGLFCTFNSSFGTSMPSGDLDATIDHFNVYDRVHLTLLNSLTMVGFVLGPLFWGPLSEFVGRRPVLLSSYSVYIVLPDLNALLGFRLLCGISAAAPTTVISGLYADILNDTSQRGAAVALYMASNTCGALLGPLISGFASQISWKWPFWIAGMIAAPGILLLAALPETFAPILYNKQIVQQRESNDFCETGQEFTQLQSFDPQKIFLRPVTLMVTEPILLLSSLYLALAYAVLYLIIQAYPIIFQDLYGLSAGISGLAYLPMVLGVFIALIIFFGFIRWHGKSLEAGKPWAQREINRRLPVACLASPCMIVSLFWLGWASWKSISPLLPAFGGIFFGVGFQLVFMSMLNYITDVFRQMSASAHAGASCLRSIGAILVPLAAGPMYDTLGVHWAPSLLGFLVLIMGIIPFLFIRYGELLAKKSNR
ncbi:hypothetical protein ASPNIDRAFT_140511, partial [Aspergillus niger ATCC 1015]